MLRAVEFAIRLTIPAGPHMLGSRPNAVSTATVARPRTRKWLLIVLLSSGLALDYFARLAIFSVLPLLRKDLAIGPVELGLLASAFLWTYGLLSPLAGFVGDRLSRRTLLILSLAGWSAVTAASAFVASA